MKKLVWTSSSPMDRVSFLFQSARISFDESSIRALSNTAAIQNGEMSMRKIREAHPPDFCCFAIMSYLVSLAALPVVSHSVGSNAVFSSTSPITSSLKTLLTVSLPTVTSIGCLSAAQYYSLKISMLGWQRGCAPPTTPSRLAPGRLAPARATRGGGSPIVDPKGFSETLRVCARMPPPKASTWAGLRLTMRMCPALDAEPTIPRPW